MSGTHARDYDFGLKIHAALGASFKNRREKGTKYNIKKNRRLHFIYYSLLLPTDYRL